MALGPGEAAPHRGRINGNLFAAFILNVPILITLRTRRGETCCYSFQKVRVNPGIATWDYNRANRSFIKLNWASSAYEAVYIPQFLETPEGNDQQRPAYTAPSHYFRHTGGPKKRLARAFVSCEADYFFFKNCDVDRYRLVSKPNRNFIRPRYGEMFLDKGTYQSVSRLRAPDQNPGLSICIMTESARVVLRDLRVIGTAAP